MRVDSFEVSSRINLGDLICKNNKYKLENVKIFLYNNVNPCGTIEMRKVILFLVALALSFPFCASAAEFFSDVREADWYFDFVREAKDLGILSGYPDGSFRPSRTVSYGEFLAMALIGESSENTVDNSHWAEGFHSRALELSYFGEADISIRKLDDPIPRCDMALIMAGVITAKESSVHGEIFSSEREGEKSGAEKSSFPRVANKIYNDIDAADSYEYFVGLCSDRGVLSGYPDGSFRPRGFLNRAEAAAAMVKLAEVIGLKEPQEEGTENFEQAELPLPEREEEVPGREDLIALYKQTQKRYVNLKDPWAARLLSSVTREYLDEIFKTAVFSKSDGSYRLNFSRPDLPQDYSGKIRIYLMKPDGSFLSSKSWNYGEGGEAYINYDGSLEIAGELSVDLCRDISDAKTLNFVLSIWNRKIKENVICLQKYYIKEDRGETYLSIDRDEFRVSGTNDVFDFTYDW